MMVSLLNLKNIGKCYQRVRSDRRGIGLLEAMVALLVLMIGIVSIIVLMLSSTLSARISRDQLMASNLAREGVEIVRSVRDSNWLKMEALEVHVADGSSYKWDDGLWGNTALSPWYGVYPTFDETAQTWGLNYTDAAVDADVWRVYWKHNTVLLPFSLYNQYSAAPDPADTVATKYTRKIYTYPICYDSTVIPPIETVLTADGQVCGVMTKIGVQVKVEVKWMDNGNARSTAVEARLYNWKQ
jgi:hypothetical protein